MSHESPVQDLLNIFRSFYHATLRSFSSKVSSGRAPGHVATLFSFPIALLFSVLINSVYYFLKLNYFYDITGFLHLIYIKK